MHCKSLPFGVAIKLKHNEQYLGEGQRIHKLLTTEGKSTSFEVVVNGAVWFGFGQGHRRLQVGWITVQELV